MGRYRNPVPAVPGPAVRPVRWRRGWAGIVIVVPVRAVQDPGPSAPPVGAGHDASPESAASETDRGRLSLDSSSDAAPEPGRHRLRWWAEIVIIVSFYGIYTAIRNLFGSTQGEAIRQAAIDNARDVIAFEQALGLYVEKGVQDLFIGWDLFIVFWNVFYGTLHFGMTIAVMVFLFARHPARYGMWRTVLGATTGLALVGFSLYPLMPPRLLGHCGEYGACDLAYSYVDTLVDPGGLWSFESWAMVGISNQYAAMPSLHVAWAVWCALAAAPVVRRRWVRVGLACYPALTVFSVVVTANHYWIDAVGGALVVAAGWLVGSRLHRHMPGWLAPPTRSAQGALSPCS